MPGSRKMVLVADSDPGLLQVLGKVLRLDGLSVETFSNGVELITRALVTTPSLVVCGYFLPGLGGLRVCRYLKGEPTTSGVPFLLLSPSLDASLRLRAEWAGVDRIEELPVRPEAFSTVCSSLIELSTDSTLFPSVKGASPTREAILEKLCTHLEERVTRLETTWKLMEELGRTMNVRGIFRKLANGVLAGLGFDRVWACRYVGETDELITVISQGRNLSGVPDSVFVRDHKDMTLGIAIRELRQVRSVEVDTPDERLWWSGSLEYVDTPLVAARRPIGLIRCDRSVTGRPITESDLEALRHTAVHTAEAIHNAMVLEEVTEEREQRDAIMNSLDSGILVVDGSGMLIQATVRACILFGKEKGDLEGRMAREVLPLLTANGADSLDRALSEEVQILDTTVHPGKRTVGNQVLSVSYIPFSRGGHFSGLVIMVKDITEEHDLRENLSRRKEELETISQIGSELNSRQDIDQICKEVVKALKRFFPSESTAVFIAEGPRERLIPDTIRAVATIGYDADTDPRGIRIRITDSALAGGYSSAEHSSMKGLAVAAVTSGKPVNIQDTREDGRYIENLKSTRSELSVPMIVQDRVAGLIDIQSPELGKFTQENERTVLTLANHAATALENATLHSHILEMARMDKLTGLGNLRVFEERLEEEFRRTDRYNAPFSLIMMDIDDFKHYNDSWGHPVGNTLLKMVVGAMKDAARETDILIRYGGEEFVCILPMTKDSEAVQIAERLRKRVMDVSAEIPHAERQPLGLVSISLGVATYPTDVSEKDMLLKYADQRMYMAKKTGKNRVVAPFLGNCQFAV
jgi:diguanylate cyclase (GGDEF)-like protein/PAS domain S-box-containing protein